MVRFDWLRERVTPGARRRVLYVGGFVALALSTALAFSGGTSNPRQELSLSFDPASEPPPADAPYSHRKLMKVRLSNNGAPVMRFVECRHLARERKKLVQVGISPDGQPVLRFQPGDYCLFASSAPVYAAAVVNNASVAIPAAAPGHARLTEFQQYTCDRFGPACAIALAVQLAENAAGACEIYHYNTSDGTLDWGYFQINSVHLRRPGLNLRDLLDCRKNIDFAYSLYLEKGFAPWTTFTSGLYRRHLREKEFRPTLLAALPRVMPAVVPHGE